VSDVFSYCREVCMAFLDRSYTEDGKIGGDGVIVEIDECKIGKKNTIEDGWWRVTGFLV